MANCFTAREMRAIKNLLINEEGGVNISNLVADLCSASKDENVDKDVMSVRVALLLSGKMPEFKPYDGYIKEYSAIYTVTVLEESLINGTIKYRINKKFSKNENGMFVEDSSYEPRERVRDVGYVEVLDRVDVELYPSKA